jgi:hypothetical protein
MRMPESESLLRAGSEPKRYGAARVGTARFYLKSAGLQRIALTNPPAGGHKRHRWIDEQAHHCKVLNDVIHLCRCSSGNPKVIHLTRGGLLVFSAKGEVSRGHSSSGYEFVPKGNNLRRSHKGRRAERYVASDLVRRFN